MKGSSKDSGANKKPVRAQDSRTSDKIKTDPAESLSPFDADKSHVSAQFVPKQEIVTDSPDQTFELARSIAQSLTGPALILLSGELGAGKTVFAKGVAAGLDIDPVDVTSPSFTLINIHEGRLRLYHIDLYRLDSPSCASLGLEEIFEDTQGVIVIEWAERLPLTPQAATRVHLERLTDRSRRILVSAGIIPLESS